MDIVLKVFVMADFLDNELKNINKGLAAVEDAKKEADNLMINKVIKYEGMMTTLKKEIDRLVEENSNFQIISKGHKELNGELRKELDEVKEDNKKLARQIEDMQQNYIRIDGKK